MNGRRSSWPRSRAEGVDLVGANGLLTSLVRSVLQTGMEVELADHLGYEPYEAAGRGTGNSRNGCYTKSSIAGNPCAASGRKLRTGDSSCLSKFHP